MPQFDPAIWPSQLFWLALIFGVLLVLMAKVGLPPIAEVLDEREVRINENLRKAEALKHEAEDVLAAYEKTMAEARAKAQANLLAARERAAAEAAQRTGELSKRLADELAAAEMRIAKSREEALAGLRDVSVELVDTVIERLIGQKLEGKAVAGAVDAVMKEAR